MHEWALEQWRAVAEDALGARQMDQCCEAVAEGLRIEPGDRALRRVRIEANRRQSNYELAVEDLRWLAEMAFEQHELTEAESCVQEALELAPHAPDLLDLLTEIQLAAGRTDEATATLARQVELYAQQDDLEQAIDRARRIVALNPESEENKELLAGLLSRADRTGEAIDLWRQIAEAYAARGAIDGALVRYAKLLELLPGDIDLLRRLADLNYEVSGMMQAMAHYDRLMDALEAEGDANAIEAEFARILDMEPGHLQLKERYAGFLFMQGRRAESVQMFLSIVGEYRDDREQPADAIRVLRRVKELAPGNADMREEEALLLEKMGKKREAAAIWRQLAEAQCEGQPARLAEALSRAAKLAEDDVELHLDAARAFEAVDQADKATHHYLCVIDVYDQQEKLSECVPVLQQAIKLNPMRMDLPDALARIYERLGDMDEACRQWLELGETYEANGQAALARQVYTHLRTLLPADREGRRRLAELCEREGDRAGAAREFKELARLAQEAGEDEPHAQWLGRVLALDPQNEACLKELAEAWRRMDRLDDLFDALVATERLYCATGRHEEALEILSELKTMRPDDPQWMARSIELLIQMGRGGEAARQGIDLIQVHFDRDDEAQALETLHWIAEIEPHNIERRISLARLVHANGRESAAFQEFFLSASKLFGEEQWEGCQQVCEAGMLTFPDDVRLRDLMARALVKLGRRADAVEVQLHLAALYDERGEEAKAQRMFESILEDQPDHQATLEAMIDWAMRHDRYHCAVENLVRLAESHYLAGRVDGAIEAMERIQSIDPARLDLKARLAEMYLETGDVEGACITWRAAAAGYLDQGKSEAAVELFERIVAQDANDLEARTSLVRALGAMGRAEEYMREAVALGDLYVELKRPHDALKIFEELVQRHPAQPMAWEWLAKLNESLGDGDGARQAHFRLYEIHREGQRLDQAYHHLESAMAHAPGDCQMLEALGDLCLSLGRRPEGVARLAEAARIANGGGDALHARELASRVLKLEPGNLAVRRLLAEALRLWARPRQLSKSMSKRRAAWPRPARTPKRWRCLAAS